MNLSVVIPTYNEKDNVQVIIKKIFSVLRKNKINGEIIIVDDNSPDGTGLIAEKLRKKYNRLSVIHRKGKLGFSSAVLGGFKIAKGDILGVMDADMSHPPEAITSLYREITSGTDFVIGSRYVKGGRIKEWNLHRKIISRGATLLAKMFTNIKDPMSGFFMIKRECVKNVSFNPKGFKICLELLLKAKYRSVSEIPITFTNRKKGKSKFSPREYYLYLDNLFGYLKLKSSLFQFMKFCLIGSIGTVISVAVLYFLTEFFNVFYMTSALFAFIVSVTNNFVLNKTWIFKEKIRENIFRKYIKFITISIIALIVNLMFLYWFVEYLKIWYVFAQVLAIGASLFINFFGNKIWTFRER